MMLLVNQKNLLEAKLDGHWMPVLEDIVQNIQIETDFSVHHPRYQSEKLPVSLVEQLQNLPSDLQQRCLGTLVSNFIYCNFYNASGKHIDEINSPTDQGSMIHENSSIMGLDLDFYQQLHQNNHGAGYFDAGWSVIGVHGVDHLEVVKRGLKLKIERNTHLKLEDRYAAEGDVVAIRKPKNLIRNGFYVAVGNQGDISNNLSRINPVKVRVYFNFTDLGAIAVMNTLTQELNKQHLPFSFKVLYCPSEYGRYDSGVLYFDKRDYLDISQSLKRIHSLHQHHFHPEVPLFTKPLAEGLGLAEEPIRKFSANESFGMNRCQAISNGLLIAWQHGHTGVQERLIKIFEQFSKIDVDLQRPYLNAQSDDIYDHLD